MTTAALPLWRSLAEHLPTHMRAIPRIGPRWWWCGPLDAEGLALGAAEAFAMALESLGTKNRPVSITLDAASVAASFDSFGRLRIDGTRRVGFAPLSGFRRTLDGWIRLHANYPHHERALFNALGTSTAEDVNEALLQCSGEELESIITANGGIAAVVREPAEWLASAPAEALANKPWIEFEPGTCGKARPIPLAGADRPLRGVRILDMTRVVAGPSASRLFGALGADVLRIDPPALPELWDQHVDSGFDKRSALADLTDPATHNAVDKLLADADADADAVLLGYRPLALQSLGFDPLSLRERHPHLAVVSLDALGTEGPHADRRGFDSIVQATTGISHMYGTGEGEAWEPGALPVQALDHATGLGMGAALLTLLRARADGYSGAAHLSLARTALELLRAAPPSGSPAPIAEPTLRTVPSPYGVLEFVPPPLVVNGTDLEYESVPVRYGSSALAWNHEESFRPGLKR